MTSTTNVSNNSLSGYYNTALSNGYVDLVFEGHTHKSYVLIDGYGVYHLQNGGDGKGISHVEIYINSVNNNYTVTVAEFVSSSNYSYLEDDPIVDELLLKYDDKISKGEEYIGNNLSNRSSADIKNLVAELYYKAGVAKWGEKYDIVLGGGYLSTRSPYDLSAGDVYYADLYSILPFDNTLMLCSIQGRYLSSKFFNTSNSNYYIYYGEYGAAVKSNIDQNATYYVIVDSYTSSYAANKLTVVEVYDTTTFARDLVAEFMQSGGWCSSAGNGGENNTNPDSEVNLTEIPEIIRLGNNLANNATSSDYYYVRGTVINVNHTTYGNMTIEDEQGNQLYVYGTYIGNVRYDSLSADQKPMVGDTVILYAPIKKYVNNSNAVTIELFEAQIAHLEKG
jgi:cyclophilin family peptidyl-prolyl cis-trans isomerase